MSNDKPTKNNNQPNTSINDTDHHGHSIVSGRELKTINKKLITLIVVTALAIVAVVVGLWVIFGNRVIGEKAYGVVGDHKIYKSDVEQLTSKNKSVNVHDATVVLADRYLSEYMARQQGVTVSQQEIESKFGKNMGALKTKDPYTYYGNMNNLYFSKLAGYNQGAYKGKLLVAHFSRNVAYDSPLLAEDKAAAPSIGNAEAIAKDKKYAEDLINGLYNKVKNGDISFDKAVEFEHNDPVVGKSAYPTLPHSGNFDTTFNNQNDLIRANSIKNKINKLRAGEITKPFVVQVSNSMHNDSMAETYFLVVRMDSTEGGDSDITFLEQLNNTKKKLGYRINV